MKRIATLTLSVSLLLAAATARSQVRLNVDDCGGSSDASWACDANTGTALKVVASVDAPPLQWLSGQESLLRVAFAEPVPDWWKIGSGQCRPGAALTVDLRAAATTCASRMADAPGPILGGMFYRIGPLMDGVHDPLDTHHLEITVVSGVDFATPQRSWLPTEGGELGLFTLTFDRRNTVGAGACGGCSACAWLWLRRVLLAQPVGVGDVVLGEWDYYASSVVAQGMRLFTDGPYCPTTPTHRSTWGQVKSLYR